MSTGQPNVSLKTDMSLPSIDEVTTSNYTPYIIEKWHLFLGVVVLLIIIIAIAVVSWWFFLIRGRVPRSHSPALSHQSFGLTEPVSLRRLVMCHFCGNFCKRGVPCPHCGVYGVGMAACHKCLLFGSKGTACKNCGTIIKTPTFCKPHCDVYDTILSCSGDNFRKMMGKF